MKKTTRIFLLTAAVWLLFSVTALVSSAVKAPAVGEFENPDGGILGVSAYGAWREYPENSMEAVTAAGKTGIDFVLCGVKKTADGQFILFNDDETGRMLSGENRAVSELSWEELSQRKLKENAGGIAAGESEYGVPLLSDALKTAEQNGFALMPEVALSLLGELCAFLAGEGYTEQVVLAVNAPEKDIEAALNGVEDIPPILGMKRGNVIFAVNSYISKAAKTDYFGGVILKTTNRYGVNFHQTVLKNFAGKLRAVSDVTDPALSGAREDSEKWWDDLISRGYSVIVTNEPDVFTAYLEENGAARARLETVYKKYTEDWTLPSFASNIFNDYKKAYTDAVTTAKTLLADRSCSTQDMKDCTAALQKAADNIDLNYEALENGTAGMTVTFPRIMLCVGAAAVVIAVQIFFFKRRKKG